MSWMTELFGQHMGFDCASITEMATVRDISKTNEIIYAQPCKTNNDIKLSHQYDVSTTVVDSPEEMDKIAKSQYKGKVLIRLLVPDKNSRQPFGKKFGAPLEWVPEILRIANKHKIPITGVSFHVGSECENPEQFKQAIEVCRKAMDLGFDAGANMDIIDIGGGFLPTESSLQNIANAIQQSRRIYFNNNNAPSGLQIQWIAEPGRFLSSTTQTLYTPVIGKKRGLPSSSPGAPEMRYTLHESVYGYFSNIPFDGQKPEFKIVKGSRRGPTYKSVLFGRTYDGADIINPLVNLPMMDEGDWLQVDDMGAYTNVTASEFNGFPKPDIVYVQ